MKFLHHGIIFLWAFLFLVNPNTTAAQPEAYTYAKRITIQASKVAGAQLAGFPVLIDITDPYLRHTAHGGHVSHEKGYDIAFAAKGCEDILPHEIEQYDPLNGRLIAWVKVPVLTNTRNTAIAMLYGNSAITANPSSTDVWDSSYSAVWHFSNDNFQDATANGNHGTNFRTLDTIGKIGGCRLFKGITVRSKIMVPHHPSLDLPYAFTLEAWINPQAYTDNGNGIMIKNPNFLFGVNWPQGKAGALNCWLWFDKFTLYTGGNLQLGAWAHVAATFDGNRVTLYINGKEVYSELRTRPSFMNDQMLFIGDGNHYGSQIFHGRIDEPRISSAARSPEWILTSVTNQQDPAQFYSVSPEMSPDALCAALPAEPVLDLVEAEKNAVFEAALQSYEQQKAELLNLIIHEGTLTSDTILSEITRVSGWGLNTLYYAGNKLKQPEQHRKAFEDLEQIRNLLSRTALKKDQVMTAAGIPAFMQQRYRELQDSLSLFESKPGAKAEFARLRSEWKNFQSLLNNRYDLYNRLINSVTPVTVERIQKELLQPGQCLLECYYGEKDLDAAYVFFITRDTFAMVRLYASWGIHNQAHVLHRALSALEQAEELPDAEYLRLLHLYAGAARMLYNRIVEPVAHMLTEDVLVVPFNALLLVPFEALLTDEPGQFNRPHLFPFLLRKHTISYTESASLLLDLRERPKGPPPPNGFVGFAPYYDGDTTALAAVPGATRKELEPLPYTGSEVFSLKRLVKGNIFLGKNATKSVFFEQAPLHRIIHLATHGEANMQLGDFSFLAFSGQDKRPDEQLLFAREIYKLALNADLVTLSACQTGLGKLQRNEGLQGLTRALALSGARSIVSSLWNVNDKHTKSLMLLFYKEIKNGLPLSKALSKAKLDFLTNYKDAALPFFWAGFVLSGEPGAISLK